MIYPLCDLAPINFDYRYSNFRILSNMVDIHIQITVSILKVWLVWNKFVKSKY